MLDSALERVVYCDPDYPSGWVHDPMELASRLARRHAFVVLGAERLGHWMRAQAESGSAPSSVCVLAQGIAPDTIVESMSSSCTLRKYLDAGGRVVWIGDVPCWYQGRADGSSKTWGGTGMAKILGVESAWAPGQPELTAAGREWGLFLPDEATRPVRSKDVVPLTAVGDCAATWFKSYHPQFPLQGFLRYRGGSFAAERWNAMLMELCRAALRGFEEPWRPPSSWRDAALEAIDRVVLDDARYPTNWSREVPESARRLAEAHGFAKLDADALARWLKARTAGGAPGSVCVLLHGIAPQTLFEAEPTDCLLRRYADAGGRCVWAGDAPFVGIGRPDGSLGEIGAGGHEAVLDIPIRWDWEVAAPPSITDTGKAWGLKTPDEALRCADAAYVTEVLAATGPFATTWLRNYAPAVPGSGFLRFRGGGFGGLAQTDELAAVALHGLPHPKRRPAAAAIETPAAGDPVGSGTFLVDRKRALDKLERFNLPRIEHFILPLARSASARGATLLRVVADRQALFVEFDGARITGACLKNPFEPLATGGEDPAERALAMALVTALRSGPVELGSRGQARRFESTDSGAPCDYRRGRRASNYVRLEQGALRLSAPRLLELLATRAPALRLRLESAKRRYPRPTDSDAECLRFRQGSVYGLLRAPVSPLAASTLEACIRGVSAGPVSLVLPGVQVEGWFNDDSLSMSLSQTSVVRNERLQETAAIIAPFARQVALRAARSVRSLRARRSRWLGRPGYEALWRSHVSRERPGILRRGMAAAARNLAIPNAAGSSAESRMIRAARTVRWLRGLARHLLSGLEGDASDPLRRALWKTPLYLTADGRGVSLEVIERSRRKDGAVRVSMTLDWERRKDGRLVVWAESGSEAETLRRRFGSGVRDVSGGPRRSLLSRAKRLDGPLARAGVDDLLAHRPFTSQGSAGEVGLRLAPSDYGGNFYVIKDGKPADFQRIGSQLRYEAALEGRRGEAAVKDAEAALGELYRGLAASLSCPVEFTLAGKIRNWLKPDSSKRETAALEHLLDYLNWTVAGNRAEAAWIRSVPLFEQNAGWASYEDLEFRLREEGVLILAEGSWLESALGGPLLRRARSMENHLRSLFKGTASRRQTGFDLYYKPPPAPACAHQAPFGCLAQGELDGRAVHLAVGAEGSAAAYPVAGGEPLPLTPAQAGPLAQAAAVAILLKAPQAVEPGAHPWRRFVFATARERLPPSAPGSGTGLLRILLVTLPIIRTNYSPKCLLEVLHTLRNYPLIYSPPGEASSQASYFLDPDELELIRTLWPEEGKLLLTQAEHDAIGKRLAGRSIDRAAILEARSQAETPGRRREVKDPIEGAKHILEELAMREGLALFWRDAAAIRPVQGKGRRVISHPDPKEWTLDVGHPDVRQVLGSSLSGEEKAHYLASIVHTAANRLLEGVPDADDARFQEGLSAWAIRGDGAGQKP